MNQNHNQNQGPTIGKISEEPRTYPTNVGDLVTQGGENIGVDGPLIIIQLTTQKDVQFSKC